MADPIFYYAVTQGWADLKFICQVLGHEITEGSADAGDGVVSNGVHDFKGWRIAEPFSDPPGNSELCDYCNKDSAQNAAGGSGLPFGEPSGWPTGFMGWGQAPAGCATYSNGAFGNCYWDDDNGGCRAPGSIDGNRIRAKMNKISYGGGTVLKNAKLIWIFWGDQWHSQTVPSRSEILRNFSLLENTPYYSSLAQYNMNGPHYFMDIIFDDTSYPPVSEWQIFPKSLDAAGNPNDVNNIYTMIKKCVDAGKIPTSNYQGAGTPQAEFFYIIVMPQGILSDPNNQGAGHHYAWSANWANKWVLPGGGGGGGTGVPTFMAAAGDTTTAGIANLTTLMCTQTQSKGVMLWTGDYANSATSTTFTTNKNSLTNCIGNKAVTEIAALGEQEGTTNYAGWQTAFNGVGGTTTAAWTYTKSFQDATTNHANDVFFLVVNTNSFDMADIQAKYTAAGNLTAYPWKICIIHHPVYGSPTAADPTPDTKNIRAQLVPFLEQNGFNIVLQGHQHNYQRSYPLKFGSGGNNPAITDKGTGPQTSPLTAFPGQYSHDIAGHYGVGWENKDAAVSSSINAVHDTIKIEADRGVKSRMSTTSTAMDMVFQLITFQFNRLGPNYLFELGLNINDNSVASSGYSEAFIAAVDTGTSVFHVFTLPIVVGHSYYREIKLVNSDNDVLFTVTDLTTNTTQTYLRPTGSPLTNLTRYLDNSVEWYYHYNLSTGVAVEAPSALALDYFPYDCSITGYETSTNHGTTYSAVTPAPSRWSDRGFPAFPVAGLDITSGTFSEATNGGVGGSPAPANEFYNLNGIVYFTVGSGGQTLQTFTSQAPYIAAQNATDFGILQLQITGRTIKGGLFDLNGAQKDSFTISKDAKPTGGGGGGGGGGTDPNAGSKDKRGIRMIYDTKAGAEAKNWFQRTPQEQAADGFSPDPRVFANSGSTSTPQQSSDYSIAGASNIFLHGGPAKATYIATKNIPDPTAAPLGTSDHSIAASRGYQLDPDDWLNTEQTIYFSLLTESPNTDNVFPMGAALVSRSGSHQGLPVAPACSGIMYTGSIRVNGDGNLVKEYRHPDLRFTPVWPTDFTRFSGTAGGGTGGGGGGGGSNPCPTGQHLDTSGHCVPDTVCAQTVLTSFPVAAQNITGHYNAGWEKNPASSNVNAWRCTTKIEGDRGATVKARGLNGVAYQLMDWEFDPSHPHPLAELDMTMGFYSPPDPTRGTFLSYFAGYVDGGGTFTHNFDNVPIVAGHTYLREMKLANSDRDIVFTVTDQTAGKTETATYSSGSSYANKTDKLDSSLEWWHIPSGASQATNVSDPSQLDFFPYQLSVTDLNQSTDHGLSYTAIGTMTKVSDGGFSQYPMACYRIVSGSFVDASFMPVDGSIQATDPAAAAPTGGPICGNQIYKAKTGGKIYTKMNITGSQGASSGIRWNVEYDDCHQVNTETTWICKLNNNPSDHYSLKTGSHGSTGETSALYEMPCDWGGGSAKWRTEGPHPEYHSCSCGHFLGAPAIPSGKNVGYKFVRWNLSNGVHLEQWVDVNNGGNGPWTKIGQMDDINPGCCNGGDINGPIGGPPGNCVQGSPDGALQDTWRGNNANSTFVCLSKVEIEPGGILAGGGGGGGGGGCTQITCQTGQHWDSNLCRCVDDSTGGGGGGGGGGELNHPGDLTGKWLGMKKVTYNDSQGNVVIDVYYDGPFDTNPATPTNIWKHYYQIKDTGTNMGNVGDTTTTSGATHCHAANSGEIFKWATPYVWYEFVNIAESDGAAFKWASVREIDPNKLLTWVEPVDKNCPSGQHFDETQQKCVDDSGPPPPPPQKKTSKLRLVWNDQIDPSDRCYGGAEEP